VLAFGDSPIPDIPECEYLKGATHVPRLGGAIGLSAAPVILNETNTLRLSRARNLFISGLLTPGNVYSR
jgi:hypothetical protein